MLSSKILLTICLLFSGRVPELYQSVGSDRYQASPCLRDQQLQAQVPDLHHPQAQDRDQSQPR